MFKRLKKSSVMFVVNCALCVVLAGLILYSLSIPLRGFANKSGERTSTDADAFTTATAVVAESVGETSPSTEITTAATQGAWSVPPTSVTTSAEADDDYVSRLIFLGDSTTYGLYHYGVLPISQVWTRSDGTLALFNTASDKIRYVSGTTDEELRIASAVAVARPEVMVITLGVNGVAMMKETSFKAAYRALINSILENSPDTKLVLNSIYPVTRSYEDKRNGINNEKIRAANGWIAALAVERGAGYLDSYTILADKSGYLKSSYSNGDGLHLSRAGLQAVINNVKIHAV